MKDLLTKSIMYSILFGLVYLSEREVPYALITKRFVHLQTWSLAAFCQKVALRSYDEYKKEVELNG